MGDSEFNEASERTPHVPATPQERGGTGRKRGDSRTQRCHVDAVEAWCRGELRKFPEELEVRLRRGELWELARADAAELKQELGLSTADANSLAGALRLARALVATRRSERVAVRSPRTVYDLLESELRGLDRETFHGLALDGKHGLLRRYLVSVGTLTTSLVHPREVFRPALRFGAASLVVVHNHPSGDPEPSPEDEEVTRRLVQAGRVLGVPLLDHVVVGERRYVSLAERLGWSEGRYRERSQRT